MVPIISKSSSSSSLPAAAGDFPEDDPLVRLAGWVISFMVWEGLAATCCNGEYTRGFRQAYLPRVALDSDVVEQEVVFNREKRSGTSQRKEQKH